MQGARVCDARLKPLAQGGQGAQRRYRILCGRPSPPCYVPHLGLVVAGEAGTSMGFHLNPRMLTHVVEPPEGAWVAGHTDGYRRLDTGDYAPMRERRPDRFARLGGVARNGQRIGRRPIPDEVRERYLLSDDGRSGFKRGVIGHVPILPFVVVCPRCGWRNVVAPPPAPPADAAQ